MTGSRVASGLLSRINERRVLEFVQRHGPASRAVMARGCGMSAPTVSKAVGSLIRNGLLEETEASEGGFGRPGKLLRMPFVYSTRIPEAHGSQHVTVSQVQLRGTVEDNGRALCGRGECEHRRHGGEGRNGLVFIMLSGSCLLARLLRLFVYYLAGKASWLVQNVALRKSPLPRERQRAVGLPAGNRSESESLLGHRHLDVVDVPTREVLDVIRLQAELDLDDLAETFVGDGLRRVFPTNVGTVH